MELGAKVLYLRSIEFLTVLKNSKCKTCYQIIENSYIWLFKEVTKVYTETRKHRENTALLILLYHTTLENILGRLGFCVFCFSPLT